MDAMTSRHDRRHHWDLAMMTVRAAGRTELIPVLDCLSGIAQAHPDTASVWPYQRTLADRLNRSTRTIQRWLAELEDLGIICRARRWMHRGDGRFTGRASRYWPSPIRRLVALARGYRQARSHRPAISVASVSPMARKTGPGAPVDSAPGRKRPPPGRTDPDGAFHPVCCGCPDCAALGQHALTGGG